MAVEFGKHKPTIGFDINTDRIQELKSGHDHTLEVTSDELKHVHQLSYTADIEDLKTANFFIVTVPTPIDDFKQPDLTPLVKASQSIARSSKKGRYRCL